MYEQWIFILDLMAKVKFSFVVVQEIAWSHSLIMQ